MNMSWITHNHVLVITERKNLLTVNVILNNTDNNTENVTLNNKHR